MYGRNWLMEFAGVDKSARVDNAGVDLLARYDKGGQCESGNIGTMW